jgi:hypothetical protein
MPRGAGGGAGTAFISLNVSYSDLWASSREIRVFLVLRASRGYLGARETICNKVSGTRTREMHHASIMSVTFPSTPVCGRLRKNLPLKHRRSPLKVSMRLMSYISNVIDDYIF